MNSGVGWEGKALHPSSVSTGVSPVQYERQSTRVALRGHIKYPSSPGLWYWPVMGASGKRE